MKKMNRYSISVSAKTYDRIRAAVPPGEVAGFVDEIVVGALEDPAILSRVVGLCRPKPPKLPKDARP